MTPKTRDDVVVNVTHRITSTRIMRTHLLHQYLTYLEDGGRRRFVNTDTEDESRQPGLQLEKGNWTEDYNYIRPGESSFRDEAYRDWYETSHLPATAQLGSGNRILDQSTSKTRTMPS